MQADGGCTKKPRIFDADSDYSFDATETEGPSTNSFFGPGGYAVWASDNKAESARLHHHLVRARLRHLEMHRHEVRVDPGRAAQIFLLELDASCGRDRANFLIPCGLPNR